MDNKTGLLGNISNAFGGRQGLLSAGLPMMFGSPQMQQQALMQGLQYGGTMQAENRKTQQAQAQRNKTLEYLQQSNPELAAMMEAGMSGSEALGLAYKAQQPPKAEKPTSAIQNFEYGQENPEFTKWQMAQKGNGLTYTAPDGTTLQMGGAQKPMKEAQAKANIYASRMENSSVILDKLETQGTDFWKRTVAGLPLGNYGVDPEYRQYEQAKRDFINATLRQESGAVIADSEFANAEQQYFPQPGDDPATIAQKKENRRIAMEAIRQASGQPATEPSSQDTGGEWQTLSNGVKIRQVK